MTTASCIIGFGGLQEISKLLGLFVVLRAALQIPEQLCTPQVPAFGMVEVVGLQATHGAALVSRSLSSALLWCLLRAGLHSSWDQSLHTELPMGDTPMDAMAVEDLGPIVLCLLKSPGEYIGQVIGLSTGKLTEAEYAAILSQQTGKNVTASKVGRVPWCR